MKASIVGAATLAFLVAQAGNAKEIVVQMKTMGKAGMMVFEPAFIQAEVGDKVRFLPSDPGHNAEIIPGMAPAGVQPVGGELSKEFVLVPSKVGLYGIKCRPHYTMGMVALVKVGKKTAANANASTSMTLPPLAAKRMAPLFAEAGVK